MSSARADSDSRLYIQIQISDRRSTTFIEIGIYTYITCISNGEDKRIGSYMAKYTVKLALSLVNECALACMVHCVICSILMKVYNSIIIMHESREHNEAEVESVKIGKGWRPRNMVAHCVCDKYGIFIILHESRERKAAKFESEKSRKSKNKIAHFCATIIEHNRTRFQSALSRKSVHMNLQLF